MSTQTPTRDGTVLLTPADAARVANVSRDTVYREIERGALQVRHVGWQLRIDPLDFRHYLERGTGHDWHDREPGSSPVRRRVYSPARVLIVAGWASGAEPGRRDRRARQRRD